MQSLRIFIICVLFSCFINRASAQYFETEILPEKNDQFKKAKYRLWIPDGVAKIRGIIVRQHGCGVAASSTGLDYANDLQWQALAKKFNMALMGTQLEHYEICAQWFDTESGSERAFLKALKNFSVSAIHPEIELVPWAFYGHSGGAYWCTNMLFKYPERILAVINRSGGIATSKWNKKMLDVPVLWIAGEYDITDSLEYIKGLTVKSFKVYRKYGAPWSIAIDPKAGHENRLGRSFYIPYLDAMLSLRLPVAGYNCRPLDSSLGWLGDYKTKEIFCFRASPNASLYSWFPNKSVAEKWKQFISEGIVIDTTVPPAPYGLHIETSNKKVFLKWFCSIDAESGLKEFRIYKKGQFIAAVPGQIANHGDVGQPANVPFQFMIDNTSSAYYVSALNNQNLESFKSKRAR